jgi:Histidine kinase-, DNA gyrase B-, and HSP90-like ATPase
MTIQLARTTFRTSRQLDFLSARELTLQCGYGVEAWPLVILKELLDNALDACEEQGVAPEITVSVDGDADASTIAVADNGAGIPAEAVEGILDFSIRVSSREAYIAPDRGAQGNALKTIVAMPFVLAGGVSGRIDIAGGGVLNEIAFTVDRIRQQPRADVTRLEEAASFVRVYLPQGAMFP